MEELRIAFLVIGSLFIIAVLVHGIWKMRKQSAAKQQIQATSQSRIEPKTEDDEGFDELGLGSVRVISEPVVVPNDDPIDNTIEPQLNEWDDTASDKSEVSENANALDIDAEPQKEQGPVYASVVSQPKPHLNNPAQTSGKDGADEEIPEPPEFLLQEPVPAKAKPEPESQEKATPNFDLSHSNPEVSVVSQADAPDTNAAKRTPKKRTPRKRKEPTLGEDQMRIDFDEPSFSATEEPAVEASIKAEPTEKPASQEQEVLVLNVRADEENPLSGAALLPLLLTLGFKFGDQDIFHRHVNANGKGPVLFSLANMVKPGVFELDNLENFTTPGISLFMVLPIEGDPHQVFNMMHNAARKIADEFGAQVLDGRRSVLTKQGVQRYSEKIREFERQRIIARSSN